MSTPASVADFGSSLRRRLVLVYVLTGVGALAVSAAAGLLAPTGRLALLAGVVLLVVPVVAVWRIQAVAVGLVLLALLIEQYPIGVGVSDLTDQIPLFTSLNGSVTVSGLYVNPMELLLAGVLVAFIVKAASGTLRLPRSALAVSIGLLSLSLLLGTLHGLLLGGSSTMALWEMRPFIYLVIFYLIGYQMPRRLGSMSALLWLLVVGVWIKTLQGVLLLPTFFATHPRPDYLLSHEDAFFFVLYIVLVPLLWLYRLPSRLRTVATLALPFVVVVDLANNRRVAWLMLAVAILVLIPLIWVRLPDRRRLIGASLAGVLVASAVYFPIFWDHSGIVGGPAAALRSAIAPDTRQSASDLYRQQENANIAFNIQQSPIIGAGFGRPIDYALPIVDLTKSDPFLAYIPHDGVMYIWMRIGIIGALVFWSFAGFAFLSAFRLSRAREKRLSVVGALSVAALCCYLVEGYLDLGLFWFRIAVFLGFMLGVLEVGRRLQAGEMVGSPTAQRIAA